jgi:hypothetical protein
MTKTLLKKTLVATAMFTTLAAGTAMAQSQSFRDTVLGFDTDIWRLWAPRGSAHVVVDAGSHTDVDCRVYDGITGAYLGRDLDATSYCVVDIYRSHSGPLEIQVENTGSRRNSYELTLTY